MLLFFVSDHFTAMLPNNSPFPQTQSIYSWVKLADSD